MSGEDFDKEYYEAGVSEVQTHLWLALLGSDVNILRDRSGGCNNYSFSYVFNGKILKSKTLA